MLKESYLSYIEKNGYQKDDAQLKVIEAYETLFQTIQNDTQKSEKPSWLSSFLKKTNTPKLTYPRGIYVYGDVGRGKTFLMDLFYDALSCPKTRMHYYHFMQKVHELLKNNTSQKDPIDSIADTFAKDYKVICLDEFHVIDITDAMILYRLLKALLDRGIFFITTSNREPKELYKNGLQRANFLPAIDLINDYLIVISLLSQNDYRERNLLSDSIWFVGDKSAQSDHFNDWIKKTYRSSINRETRSINGHDFSFYHYNEDHKIAWCSFSEACEKNRASRDYIELSNTLNTFILSEIPEFTEFNLNAVRRFIVMIDEFYDQGVKVLFGSNLSMFNLYQKNTNDTLDFEFDRTISRLTEMQTDDYFSHLKRRLKE